jgi:hypothetical protein
MFDSAKLIDLKILNFLCSFYIGISTRIYSKYQRHAAAIEHAEIVQNHLATIVAKVRVTSSTPSSAGILQGLALNRE